MSKLQTEFVKIAQSGVCVDGREIKGQWLLDMAETYSPGTYTALIWPDHQRWQGNFGTVTELRAEEEGGVVSLFARLNPNERYAYVNEQRQKLFFSIEVAEDFAKTGKAYLVGLGITDQPASLGTSKMQFSAESGDCSVFPGVELFACGGALTPEEVGFFRRFLAHFKTEPKPETKEEPMDKEQYAALMERLGKLEEAVGTFAAKPEPQGEEPAKASPEAAAPDQYAALMGKVDELAAGFSALASRLEAAKPGAVIPDTTTPADDAAIL